MAKKAATKKAAKKAAKKKTAKRRSAKGLTTAVLNLGAAGSMVCPRGYHADGYVVIGGVTYPNCVPD